MTISKQTLESFYDHIVKLYQHESKLIVEQAGSTIIKQATINPHTTLELQGKNCWSIHLEDETMPGMGGMKIVIGEHWPNDKISWRFHMVINIHAIAFTGMHHAQEKINRTLMDLVGDWQRFLKSSQ